ncbi:testis-specific protein 10-interacting protein [Ambystoma mexicanum]|uniref:testis-specific protein 10-interacting protein n=1 Tax=Ambystoma mexicanum TaxID=8296 RepID=UPI0037E71DFB
MAEEVWECGVECLDTWEDGLKIYRSDHRAEPLENKGRIQKKKKGVAKSCVSFGDEDDETSITVTTETTPRVDWHHAKTPSIKASECKSDCCQEYDSIAFLSSHIKELQVVPPEDSPEQEPRLLKENNCVTFQQRWDGAPDSGSLAEEPTPSKGKRCTSKNMSHRNSRGRSPKPLLATISEEEKKRGSSTQTWQDKVKEKDQDKKMPEGGKFSPRLIMKQYDEARRDNKEKRKQWLMAMKEPLYFNKVNKPPSPHFIGGIVVPELTEHATTSLSGDEEVISQENTSSNKDVAGKRKGSPGSPEPPRLHSSSPRQGLWFIPGWEQRWRMANENELTFRPAINKSVPNFDRLQRKFQKSLEQTRVKRTVTMCKPFKLHTPRTEPCHCREEQKEKNSEKIHKDNHRQRRERLQRPCSSNSEALPSLPSTNNTFEKRQTAIRTSLLEAGRRAQEQKEVEDRRKRRAQRIRRRVQKCLSARRTLLGKKEELNKKVQEHRQQSQERSEEYQVELREMLARVNQRPFLFQQATQYNSQLALVHRFSQILGELGQEENMLAFLKEERKSRPPSQGSQ